MLARPGLVVVVVVVVVVVGGGRYGRHIKRLIPLEKQTLSCEDSCLCEKYSASPKINRFYFYQAGSC